MLLHEICEFMARKQPDGEALVHENGGRETWRALNERAELIAASEGLGYLIMSARRILAAPDVIVGMLTIGFLGLLFDYVFRILERRLYARTA